MAIDVANLLLRITGENNDAKKALDEVAAAVLAFAQEDAAAHIRVEGKEAALDKIRELEAALTIIGNRDVTARVKVKIADSRAELSTLRRELEHALSGGLGARPVEAILGDIGQLGASIAGLGSQAGGLGQVAGGFAGIASSASEAAGSIPVVGGAIAALGPVGLAVIPIIIGLIGSLIAAVVSLGAVLISAAGGFAVLAVAAAGAFAPIIALAIPAFIAFAKVIKEATLSQADLAKRSQDVADSQQSVADAHRGVAEAVRSAHDQIISAQDAERSATQSLANANEQLQTATTDAYRAWRDAIEAVKDDLLSVQEANLGVEQAQLNLQKAKLHLRELRGEAEQAGPTFVAMLRKFTDVDIGKLSTGKVESLLKQAGNLSGNTSTQLDVKQALLDVSSAQLGIKSAQDRVHDSNTKLADDRKVELSFLHRGIQAYGPYRQAVQNVADSQRALARATERANRLEQQGIDLNPQVISAREGLARAERQLAAAHAAANPQGFTREMGRLVGSIRDFVKEVQHDLGPAIDQIFGGIADLLKDIGPTLRSARPEFKLLGTAIGDMFRAFGGALKDPATRKALDDLITNAARLVRDATPGLIALLTIITTIADDAMPALVGLVRRLAGWLERVAENGKLGGFKGTIHTLVGSFKDVARFAGSFLSVIGDLVDIATPLGRGLVRHMTKMLDDFDKFANSKEGRDEIRQWLSDALDIARPFVRLIGRLVELFIRLTTLTGDLEPLWGPLLDTLNTILGVIDDILKKIHQLSSIHIKIPGVGGSGGGFHLPINPLHLLPNPKHPIESIPFIGKPLQDLLFGAEGGIATKPTLGVWGESGTEALIPLKQSVLASIGHGIFDAMQAPSHSHMPKVGAFATPNTTGGPLFGDVKNYITVPGGGSPDERVAATKISTGLQKLNRRVR